MICIYFCGLFRWVTKRCFDILNYFLDLIYDTDEDLRKILFLNNHDLYFVLKNWGCYNLLGENRIYIKPSIITPRIKIICSSAKFQSFGHHLSGANFHVFNYHDDRIQNLIWQLKFNDNIKTAKFFGYSLAKNLYETQLRSKHISDFFISNKCYLVPIPIHYKRFFERGYNQSDRLCREIVRNLNNGNFIFPQNITYLPKILKRDLYTQKQSWTKNENRLENIKNVFVVNNKFRSMIKGSKIILIDDVFTTGATVNEASRTLRRAGADEVISFTIAR